MKILILILLLANPCYAWDTTDTVLQTAVTATLVADWMQTRDITRHRDVYYETNSILGKYPHKDRVDIYFATCIVGNAVISYLLPETARTIWQSVVIGMQVNQVVKNYQLGIRIDF